MSDCSSISSGPRTSLSGSAKQVKTKGVPVPLTDHVALVSLTRDIPTRLVLQAAAAIQKQITRDFTPYWGLRVTVDAFEDLESVPSDYHPIVIFGGSGELVQQLDYAVGEERAADDRRRLRARAAVGAAHELVHPPAVRAGRRERDLERDAEPRGAGDDQRPVRQPAGRRRAPARPARGGCGTCSRSATRARRSGTRSTACRSPTSTARGTSTRCSRTATATASPARSSVRWRSSRAAT